MTLSRILLGLWLALIAPAHAVDAPTYTHAGTNLPAIGVFCLDLSGSYAPCGGFGAGSTTANQGTPGASAWPMTLMQGGALLSAANPIFAQITNTVATTVSGSVSTTSAVTSLVGGIAKIHRLPSSAASTNLTQVSASAGRIYRFVACNTTTTPIRIKFFNALSAAVTVGTTAPYLVRPLPAAASAGGLACASFDVGNAGWSFSGGISYALVTGAADNDATAVAAGAVTDFGIDWQ